MTKETKTTGKTVKSPASKKVSLKGVVKTSKVVMPRLSGNHNETFLVR
jgi:hypothetical protein